MLRNVYFAPSVLVALGIYLALAQNGSPITGQWALGAAEPDGQVRLTLQRSGPGFNMNSTSPVPLSQLRGLSRAELDSSGSVVHFDLVRDAGTLRFTGYLQNGGGGGAFTFTPSASFAGEMRSLGFEGLSDEKVFTMAVHDVSAAYVRDMNALGIHPDSIDQLISMRIHNVTVDYAREFKSLDYTELTPDKLVTMRIHGVTAAFARELKVLGYNSVSIDQMVTMRIHGITPEYIRKTRTLGLGNLTIDQLVNVKIHDLVD
ncbi:MAG TPA: hypothetical protein VH640_30680 [Bryobacteraceae bacterium]